MVKPHYALSYNDGQGTPNWVSWRVTAADLGDAPRKREFDPDPQVPPATTPQPTTQAAPFPTGAMLHATLDAFAESLARQQVFSRSHNRDLARMGRAGDAR